MTKLEALRALEQKVSAGDLERYAPEFERAFYALHKNMDHVYSANDAYHGSLDAALSLHQAVLPNWETTIYFDTGGAKVELGGPNCVTKIGEDADPARAWLLAIIRALITMEEQEEALTKLARMGQDFDNAS